MERPIATAARVLNVGSLVVTVVVSKLDEERYAVTFSCPFKGAGTAVGNWPHGFFAGDIPKRSERKYFCETFKTSPFAITEYIRLNEMYLEALKEIEEVKK